MSRDTMTHLISRSRYRRSGPYQTISSCRSCACILKAALPGVWLPITLLNSFWAGGRIVRMNILENISAQELFRFISEDFLVLRLR
jgi:hypothetical protein